MGSEEHYLNILHDMVNHIKADTKGRSQFSGRGAKETKLVCLKCEEALAAKTIFTKKKIFTHAAYPNDCGFMFWKEFMGCTFTEKEACPDGREIRERTTGLKKWSGLDTRTDME